MLANQQWDEKRNLQANFLLLFDLVKFKFVFDCRWLFHVNSPKVVIWLPWILLLAILIIWDWSKKTNDPFLAIQILIIVFLCRSFDTSQFLLSYFYHFVLDTHVNKHKDKPPLVSHTQLFDGTQYVIVSVSALYGRPTQFWRNFFGNVPGGLLIFPTRKAGDFSHIKYDA